MKNAILSWITMLLLASCGPSIEKPTEGPPPTPDYLEGTYISADNDLFPRISFKKNYTAIIYAIVGAPFVTSYVVDDLNVIIKGDENGNFFLKIKDQNTLEGGGYMKGTYTKE